MGRSRLFILMLALALGTAVPGSGRATVHELLATGAVPGECSGMTTPTGDGGWYGDCVGQFTLTRAGYVSLVESHANFHVAMPVIPGGYVSVSWFDPLGRLIFGATCQYLTGLAPEDGVGPLELVMPPAPHNPVGVSAGCTSRTYRNRFSKGIQKIVTTAAISEVIDPMEPLEFHGKLMISPASSPV